MSAAGVASPQTTFPPPTSPSMSESESEFAFRDTLDLPEGQFISVPGRGTMFVYDSHGDVDTKELGNVRATVILLHGWTVTAALNFHEVFNPLAERANVRVLAIDQRGHGRGIKPKALFKLQDCADDVGALISTLRLANVVVVGYSMGGAVAQLVTKTYPDRVRGAIFCATAAFFGQEQKKFSVWDVLSPAVATGLTVLPFSARQAVLAKFLITRKGERVPAWMRDEFSRSDPAMIAQAGLALGKHDARPWLADLTLPTAVVKTLRDETVSVRRQGVMFDALRNVTLHECDADHRAAVSDPETFLTALLAALDSVLQRS